MRCRVVGFKFTGILLPVLIKIRASYKDVPLDDYPDAGFWLEGNPVDQQQLDSELQALPAKGSKLREVGLDEGQVSLTLSVLKRGSN